MEHGEVQPIEMEMGRSCHRYDVQCSQHNVQLPHQVTRILVFDKIGDRRCKNKQSIGHLNQYIQCLVWWPRLQCRGSAHTDKPVLKIDPDVVL